MQIDCMGMTKIINGGQDAADKVSMASAFRVMNKILRYVERSLDDETFDGDGFTAEAFGISFLRFARLLEMLLAEGYLTGIEVVRNRGRDEFDEDDVDLPPYDIRLHDPAITIPGMKFLAENSVWAKALKTVKDARELMP